VLKGFQKDVHALFKFKKVEGNEEDMVSERGGSEHVNPVKEPGLIK
jgi:hypothetical protein